MNRPDEIEFRKERWSRDEDQKQERIRGSKISASKALGCLIDMPGPNPEMLE